MDKTTIEYAREQVMRDKVKQVSENHFEVLGHNVWRKVKPGRTLLHCDCKNDTDYCNESPICVHKISIIFYLGFRDSMKVLDAKIQQYKTWDKMGMESTPYSVAEDLQNLKRLLFMKF